MECKTSIFCYITQKYLKSKKFYIKSRIFSLNSKNYSKIKNSSNENMKYIFYFIPTSEVE